MGLLPVSGAALGSDARVRDAARDIGTRYGVDYTDDAAVTALLTEQRKALETGHRPAGCLGLLTLMAGMFLPFGLSISPALDAHLFAVLGAAGGLTVVGVALLVHARAQWKRALRQGPLAGYREVLGVARAHGIPLAHIPPWLEGRTAAGRARRRSPRTRRWSRQAIPPPGRRRHQQPHPSPYPCRRSLWPSRTTNTWRTRAAGTTRWAGFSCSPV